jgi:hypothetical protein
LGHLNNVMIQAMATPGAVVCRVGDDLAEGGSFLWAIAGSDLKLKNVQWADNTMNAAAFNIIFHNNRSRGSISE